MDGTVRVWNISPSTAQSNAAAPGKLELGSPVTSLHFSPQCKEIMSTHGSKPTNPEDPVPPQTWPRVGVANAIVIHSYPSLRHVTTFTLAEKPIGNSVLNANGTKAILAVPDDGKISVCDVWSKRKELKRQPSFYQQTIR